MTEFYNKVKRQTNVSRLKTYLFYAAQEFSTDSTFVTLKETEIKDCVEFLDKEGFQFILISRTSVIDRQPATVYSVSWKATPNEKSGEFYEKLFYMNYQDSDEYGQQKLVIRTMIYSAASCGRNYMSITYTPQIEWILKNDKIFKDFIFTRRADLIHVTWWDKEEKGSDSFYVYTRQLTNEIKKVKQRIEECSEEGLNIAYVEIKESLQKTILDFLKVNGFTVTKILSDNDILLAIEW